MSAALRRLACQAGALCALSCGGGATAPDAPAFPRAAPSAAGASHPEAQRDTRPGYQVRLDQSGIAVRLCFCEGPGAVLLPHPAAPPDLVTEAELESSGGSVPLAKQGAGFALPPAAGPGDCVSYHVGYAALAGAGRGERRPRARQFANAWLLAPEYWLWHTEPKSELPVRFQLDESSQLGLPWREVEARTHTYLIPVEAHEWSAVGAVGKLRVSAVSAGALDLKVAGVGLDGAEYLPWLRASAEAASLPFAGLPRQPALAVLVPQRSTGAGFGLAYRGGGRSTLLYVGEQARAGHIGVDWAATHELFHLLMPYVRLEDAWFTEGMATYYTALLRGRVGALSEREVWWELVDGFERGSATAGSLPLTEESEQMHERRSYWRVYWSGAAIALAWEVALIDAGKNLDALTALLAAYDREGPELWTAEDLIRRAEGELGVSLWPIAQRALETREFFDYHPALQALGVHGDASALRLGAGRLSRQRLQLTAAAKSGIPAK